MSRTDKDRPYWVQNAEIGRIDHDHRDGECVVQDLTEPAHFWRRHHWRHCKKYVTIEWRCTKAEPNRDCRGVRTCWTGRYVWSDVPGDSPVFVWTQCVGHSRREKDESIPCTCDDEPDAPTCTLAWSLLAYGRGAPPKWYRRYSFYGPERQRERAELGEYRKRFNAVGWEAEDEWDFANRQARSGAKYCWW